MLQAFRGTIGRPHVASPGLKSCGSRFLATKRSPFDTDQNEDGFMLVGGGARPSSLRPNLNDSSSTTSDDNWAQILQDVDPPSYNITNGPRLAMRPTTPMTSIYRKQLVTQMERRAMDAVFERVFNMDTSSIARGSTIGNLFLSGTMGFAPKNKKFPPRNKAPEDLERMFDEKQEAILNCKTDQELLQWAVAEVFQEPLANASPSSETSTSDTGVSTQPAPPNPIHPAIYARVIALLMFEFREKYNNPHLAISIFDYTRRRSIISFVTGCTTPSYNELMRTHWNSFRDLQMVVNIAEEMRANGVPPDDRTRRIYLRIYEEAVKLAAWFEGGQDEVLKTLARLDGLTKPKSGKPQTPKREVVPPSFEF